MFSSIGLRLKSVLGLPTTGNCAILALVMILAYPILTLRTGAFGSDMSYYMESSMSVFSDPSTIFFAKRPAYVGINALAFYLFGPTAESAVLVTKLAAFGCILALYGVFRRSFDFLSGLLFVGSIVTVGYMVTLPAHLIIDHTVFFFMAFGLYLMYVGFQEQRIFFVLVSGMVMGLGFFTKEIAVLWFPLSVYLVCGIPEWRTIKNLALIFINFVGIGLVVVGWALLNPKVLEDISRVDEYRAWYPYIIIGCLTAISIGVLLYFGLLQKLRSIIRNPSRFDRIWPIAGWAAWFGITAVFSVFLALRTNPDAYFTSVTEVWPRLKSFWAYMDAQIAWQPMLEYLPFAAIVVVGNAIFKTKQGDRVLGWCVLALLPLALMNVSGAYELKPRYGVPIFWISYVILGRAIAIVIELLSSAVKILPTELRFQYSKQFVTFTLTSIVLILFVRTAYDIPNEYAYFNSPYYGYLNENNDTLRKVAEWIQNEVPTEANFLSGSVNNDILNFYSNGAYQIHDMTESSSNNLFETYSISDRISHPYYFDIRIGLEDSGVVLSPAFSTQNISELSSPTYIQPGRYPGRYAIFSEKPLVELIHKLGIDYIILSESEIYRSFNAVPQYFVDTSAFSRVYSTSWTSRNHLYKLHVFKVDRDNLVNTNYPLSINVNAWTTLSKAYVELADTTSFDSYQMIGDLFQHKLIQLNPKHVRNRQIYETIANDYLLNGDSVRAALYYHFAHEFYNSTEQLPDLAENLLSTKSDLPESQLILGDILKESGQIQLAREMYQSVIEGESRNPDIDFAATTGLAELAYDQKQYELSAQLFDRAMTLSKLDASDLLSKYLLAQGFAALDAQDNETAKIAFEKAAKVAARSTYSPEIDSNLTIEELLLRRSLEQQDNEYFNLYDEVLTGLASDLDGRMALTYMYSKQQLDLPLSILQQLIASYEMAIVEEPYNMENYSMLQRIYLKMNQIEPMIALYEKQVEIWPHDVNFRYQLGEVRLKADNVQGAEDAYWSALELDPSFLNSYKKLKQIYVEINAVEELATLNDYVSSVDRNSFWLRIEAGNIHLEQIATDN